jgi:hypothetical protein
MAYNKAKPHTDWLQRPVDYRNIDSLKYVYSIASPKLPGNKFATHTDFVTRSYPSFTTGDWHRLSNGGSRDSVLERYLAVVDDAGLLIETADGPKTYSVPKGSITLVEWLPNKTFRVSIPLGADSIEGGEAEDNDAA